LKYKHKKLDGSDIVGHTNKVMTATEVIYRPYGCC